MKYIIIYLIVLALALLFIYPFLAVGSKCSRIEEQWEQEKTKEK